jgi:hypothetical protein
MSSESIAILVAFVVGLPLECAGMYLYSGTGNARREYVSIPCAAAGLWTMVVSVTYMHTTWAEVLLVVAVTISAALQLYLFGWRRRCHSST